MHLEFYGAAGGVTGSLHRLHVNGADVLLDCGLFQGHREESNRRNRELPDWAAQAHALVLSHAHIDHSGNIPTLVKRGFKGNIYCTPPTRDLSSVMLRDSAMIQQQDAAYLNRKLRSKKKIEPLYTVEEAQRAVGQMISVPLHRPIMVAPGVTATFHDSGHVLGSALVELNLSERGVNRKLLFTGDLGRAALPLLKDPEIVSGVEVLLTESTYGDRVHPGIEGVDDALGEIVRDTIDRGGRVYIPSFALERAQEVLFALDRLHDRGAIPRVPIYIDSPLAIAITEIYKLHPESLEEDIKEKILSRDDPFSPPGLSYVSHVDDSKDLQLTHEPCIIIAGSGMCEGGRILFHLARALQNPKNTVVIVGFQAQHTLGRRLLEGRNEVKVLGVEREVRAKIKQIEGLSAHADRNDLIEFARRTQKVGNLRKIALVHGEDEARAALAEGLREVSQAEIVLGEPAGRLEL